MGCIQPIKVVTFDNGPNFGRLGVTGLGDITFDVVCFTAGTLIDTKRGEVAVEALREGDLVRTADRGFQPIRWIGCKTWPAEGQLAPVVIDTGTLGNAAPLMLSPQHWVVVAGAHAELLFAEEELLIAAKHLVNGRSIRILEGGDVTYYHILFDTHEIVFANGAALRELPSRGVELAGDWF